MYVTRKIKASTATWRWFLGSWLGPFGAEWRPTNHHDSKTLWTMVMLISLDKPIVAYVTRGPSISTSSTRGSVRFSTNLKNCPGAVWWFRRAASALTALCFSGSSNFPSRHVMRWSTAMRRRWWLRPEIDRADFGTSRSSISSLVFTVHLHASGLASISLTTCGNFPRLVKLVILLSQSTAAGVRHRTAEFWQELTFDRRLASGGAPRNRATWTSFVDLYETLCVAGFCTTADDHRFCNPIKPRGSTSRRGDRRDMTHRISRNLRRSHLSQ